MNIPNMCTFTKIKNPNFKTVSGYNRGKNGGTVFTIFFSKKLISKADNKKR